MSSVQVFSLSERAKEARRQYYREYMRKYRKQNPEKIQEATKRFWERRAQELENQQNA